MPKRLLPLIVAAAALAAPAAAAADTLLAADPHALHLTALDGKRVWVSGKFGHESLMMQTGSEAAQPVPGAPTADAYQRVDLGHDAKGRLVLTYIRCLTTVRRCSPIRDDLQGHRATIRGLAPSGCSVSTAPAYWGTRVAYGVGCARGSRGGLYVRSGSGAVRRLPLPKDAVKYGAKSITWVDLRGTRVGAVASDIYEYAFSQSVNGHAMRSFLAAASEGDTDDHVTGMSLGTGGALWSVDDVLYAGDPNTAVIHYLTATCDTWETLTGPPFGPDYQLDSFPASGLAVDGTDLYLITPAGIVQHTFTPGPGTVPACGTPGS